MSSGNPAHPHWPRYLWLSHVVLACGLILSLLAMLYVAMTARAQDLERFSTITATIEANIRSRLQLYVSMLRSTAGFCAVEEPLDAERFAQYVAHLDLAHMYPGVQGVGFSRRIPAAELDEVEQQMRRRHAAFHVWPNDPRKEYHSIVFLQPEDRRNQAALGYDMFSEPTRRAAMETARDSGAPAASGIVTLVQEIDEHKQAGFLIYAPVYAPGDISSVEQRRKLLRGFAYSPFRADDLLEGILGMQRPNDVDFTIADHGGQRLYASDPAVPTRGRLSRSASIDIAGRHWQLEFTAHPGFERSSGQTLVPYVFLGGVTITLLLFGLIRSQLHARATAEGNTAELLALEENRKQLLHRAEDARREAESANRVKDEFLAMLSHELRTPINAILGWAQLLRSGQTDPADLTQGLETIERNAKTQAQLIEDLLDVSRIISGKLRLEAKPMDLVKVMEAAIDTMRPAAHAKDIRLEPVFDASATNIWGDASRLQQVVWNLLSNAVKFTPPHGRVQVLLQRIDDHAVITVLDTGRGIDPEFVPYVFDAFRQADGSTTRKHGGLGLGLAIVRHMVELHGGTVQASSEGPGTGSTFTVHLPLSTQVDAPSVPAVMENSTAATTLAGVRVLLVDDEPDARSLASRVLEGAGATVFVAAAAVDALGKLQAVHPDVLVSDIAMPEEDGYELIRRVRSLSPEHGGTIPAVALTAYARMEDRRRAILAGFQVHVSKPVEAAELVSVVATLAGRNAGAR